VALKRTRNRVAFVWWMLFWGGVLFSPVLLWLWRDIPPLGWVFMLASAVFEALYFAAVALAYQSGDLSIVYPLARGTAPVWLVLWAVLFLGESLTRGGVGGVGLIALGLYVINLPAFGAWVEPLRALNQPGPRWALVAGVCISLYTAIDRQGIRQVAPLLYTYLALWLTWLGLTPWTLNAVGWEGLLSELRHSRWNSVLAGFTTTAAYAMVLYAVQAGTPAGYAGAVREISAVLGVIVGVVFLKEPGPVTRFAGAALVAGGVMVIKLFG